YLAGCQIDKDDNVIIDIKEPAQSLSIFGEDILSTPLYERDMAISPQFDEIIYTLGDYKQNRRCLVAMKYKNGNWSKPEILNISGTYHDIEPFFSHDGNRLYFASDRPIFGDTTRNDYNIWYSDRNDGLWSEPVALDTIINTKQNEYFPSLSLNGNLYFTSVRENGIGREDIFISKFVDGKYLSPSPLSSEINTISYEFNAFISLEEDYIIFSSFGREDGFGGGDLYISVKDAEGNWAQARNLGSKINSDKLDYCPFVDAESHNFYFTSERISGSRNKLETIEDLKNSGNSIENGFGNIYRISFNELNINVK
ncbi:MAG: hypothetical protein Q7V19_10810, partial [Bacteroidales bacterium]|nr:hypothetical protein [Bacteroidales bacterium]